jgi:hypothetical protein
MRISAIELRRIDGREILSGDLGSFRLSYQFPPGEARNTTGDAFVTAALLAAMATGETLELDSAYTLSPALSRNLLALQEIFSVWMPGLRRVEIAARLAPPPPPRSSTASFFSGGVDSLYTFLEKGQEVSALLHIRGFDYRRENEPLVREIDDANERFVRSRGKTLAIVGSNLRDLYDSLGMHANVYHGGHLASVGLAAGFSRVYVPSTLTWDELLPWGSHPVTDSLWGSESVQFVNHGADATRVDKLRRLGADQEALELVRVCASNVAYSCGVCEKCLRTRAGLRVLGLSSSRPPRLDGLGRVRALRFRNEFNRLEWEKNQEWAARAGDRALARAIALALARYQLRVGLQNLDRLLFGGRLKGAARRLARILRPPAAEPPLMRIDRPV